MKQLTFADAEYENKKRKTRRELFLERMDKPIPWERLEAVIEPFYPSGQGSRPMPCRRCFVSTAYSFSTT